MADEFFLSRWSRLKSRSKQELEEPEAPVADSAPAAGTASDPATPELPAVEKPPLPPVESLTGDSDFTPFMDSGVDPNLRRQALRKLLRDPRFDVMDGLDTYIADFSKPDPIPEEWMSQLYQMTRLGEYKEPEPEAETTAGELPSPAEAAPATVAESGAEAGAAETSPQHDSTLPVDDSSPAGGAK